MAELLRVFVSATNDLETERAIIGRALAHLPVQVGAEIRRTPIEGGSYETMYELLAYCDRVYFMLGQDITAPAGAEWYTACELERSILPLRSTAYPTPAAREFMRGKFVDWQIFRSVDELARIVTLDLIDVLSHPRNRYGLNVSEIELLSTHAQRMRQATQVASSSLGNEENSGGAGGGGVIIDHGRRGPLEGILIEER